MQLADYLAAHNLTDAAFADVVKCDRTTILRLRSRKITRPDWQTMEAIAAATNGAVTPNDFLAPPAAEPTREPEAVAS